MHDVLTSLTRSLDESAPFVFCRLVETRGSTPQKAGAMMLVFPDGRQAGTLGGGCVEADVKRTALLALQEEQPRIATFQLDHDYGWDDGLICGGRVKILIQPYRDCPTMVQYYRSLVAIEQGVTGTEAIVFDADAAGLPAASRYLFDAQSAVPADAQRLAGCAGGHTPATETPCRSAPRVCCAGCGFSARPASMPTGDRRGGHIGKAVAQLAETLEFDVWVIDDRPEFVGVERFPDAQRRMSGDLDVLLPRLDITPDTYCLIVTRGHSHDEKALFHLVQRNARYVGMIGSRRKIRMIFDDLLEEGISADSLRRSLRAVGHRHWFANSG